MVPAATARTTNNPAENKFMRRRVSSVTFLGARFFTACFADFADFTDLLDVFAAADLVARLFFGAAFLVVARVEDVLAFAVLVFALGDFFVVVAMHRVYIRDEKSHNSLYGTWHIPRPVFCV